MKKLTLNTQGEQSITEYLEDGEPITFKFNYRPNACSWFFDFTYKNLTRKNIQVVSGVGMLRPFKNLLPIDLYVKTTSLLNEPYLINSFSLNLAELYIVSLQESDEIVNGTLEL